MSALLFIAILFVLVFVHECGHFLVAKYFGIRVDEFGLGFPPRVARLWKRGDTEYTLNWIPFGGFVKIFGENPGDDITGDEKRSFIKKPKLIQAAVLVAGVVFNLLFAWMLLSFGFMVGMPASGSASTSAFVAPPRLTITNVTPESPASYAGFKSGDIIIGVGDEDTIISKDLDPRMVTEFILAHPEEAITISYERKGEDYDQKVTPHVTEGVARIGIAMDTIGTIRLPIHKAIYQGLLSTYGLTKDTIISFGHLIGGIFGGPSSGIAVSGPIGIAGMTRDAYQFGFMYLLFFMSILSINLAVINLIPFPALDGGRLLFLLIEKIRGKSINHKIVNLLNAVGFGLLILLMVVITYKDIARLF